MRFSHPWAVRLQKTRSESVPAVPEWDQARGNSTVEASQPKANNVMVVKKIPRMTTPQYGKDAEKMGGESLSAAN
jgi:hypothetical protein